MELPRAVDGLFGILVGGTFVARRLPVVNQEALEAAGMWRTTRRSAECADRSAISSASPAGKRMRMRFSPIVDDGVIPARLRGGVKRTRNRQRRRFEPLRC